MFVQSDVVSMISDVCHEAAHTTGVLVFRYGPNILLNRVAGYQRPSLWQCLGGGVQAGEAAATRDLDNSIVSGFQLATLSGPMCEEPLMGVCFSVEKWDIQSSVPPQHQEEASTSRGTPADCKGTGSGATRPEATEHGPIPAGLRPEAAADCYGPVSGQLIAAMKEACRHAFQAQPQRLMAAMYTCEIMTTADVLGKTISLTTPLSNQEIFLV